MILSNICRLWNHKVNRQRVWDDGLNFRTRCAMCDAALIRMREGWREFDAEKDANNARLPHPSGELQSGSDSAPVKKRQRR